MGQRTTRFARAVAAPALVPFVLGVLSGCGRTAAEQGRTALVVWTKSDAANGSWVYVGHHESFRDGKPLMNPITGKMEFNGTSILDITDPAKPKYVWHIPNQTNKNSRSTSVVYDYKFDQSGRDYLIRNSEALT